jgi:hypothetical protein
MSGGDSGRRGSAASAVFLAGFGLWWYALTVADPDLWGHLRFGRDILRAGAIIQADVYSYRTEGQRWINHEWLSEAIFAAIEGQAGPAGLILGKVAIALGVLGLGHRWLCRAGLGPWISVALLVLVSVPYRMGLGTVRPQIFTYLGFFLLLLILKRADDGRPAWLVAVPGLLAAWVNLHGGVLAGLGILAVWLAARAIGRLGGLSGGNGSSLGAMVRGGLLGASCAGALLVNPYGADLPLFLLREGTGPRPEISEWNPVVLTSLPGAIYLSLVALAVVSLAASARPRRFEASGIVGVTAVLPMIAARHYPLFALALIVYAGGPIAERARSLAGSADRPHLRTIFAAAGLAGGVLLAALSVPRFGCIRIDPLYFGFPARSVAFLKHSGVRANMAVPFAWGEYVIGHLGPAVKVSIDGRRETVYSPEAYRQSIDFERGTGIWDAVLNDAPTDLVLVPNGSPTANLMSQRPGWLPLCQDRYSVMFVRHDFPALDRLLATPIPPLPPDGAGLCYPAPGRSVSR